MKRHILIFALLITSFTLYGCNADNTNEETATETITTEEINLETEELANEETTDTSTSEESEVETVTEEPATESIDVSSLAILPDTLLSEEEQSIVGIWESEDGCVLAIRERGHEANESEFFELDVIQYTTKISDALKEESGIDGMWIKITRESGSSFSIEDGCYKIQDSHLCPTGDGGDADTLYEVTYDIAGDFLTLTYNQPSLMDLGTYYRTDKEITEADWDYYYNLCPDRKPN